MTTHTHSPTSHRLLRLPQVLEITGLGKTKIYALIKLHQFPAPKKIGRISAWLNSDIEAWVTNGHSVSVD
ncbi:MULTISPECIES: helix-turn-helix transcriptional regulator [unclassified Thiocapsa]|uniref:helix-turn-helix transcriptional regulator n=1 Tax=unclassified Thiocapsa TaxID=2641286 RepID=UPI0035B19D08